MTREPSPVHARAASGASNHVGKPEAARRPMANCAACAGTGRVHIQHKRPFRVESRECECARLAEGVSAQFDAVVQQRMRQLQGEAP